MAAVVAALAIHACAPVYNPNAVHTPLYTQKGEMHAATYLGTQGFDTYVSYSPWDHWAFGAAVSIQEKEDSTFASSRNYGELAVGYYLYEESVGRIDLFAGIGTGTATSFVGRNETSYAYGRGWLKEFSGSFNRFFIQGSVGLPVKTSDAWFGIREFESGVVVRASAINFYSISYSDRPAEFIDNVFFEPIFFMRSGWKHVKLELQAGVSFPLAERVAYDWQLVHVALGFHVVLGGDDDDETPGLADVGN
jgi:hypothetical protein